MANVRFLTVVRFFTVCAIIISAFFLLCGFTAVPDKSTAGSRLTTQNGTVASPTATTTTPTITNDTIIIDFGVKQIKFSDDILQNGWFNYDTKVQATNNKTIKERAKNLKTGRQFEMAFPDIINYINKYVPEFETKAYDGQVVFHPHSEHRFTVKGQKNGKKIDRKKLYADILTQLQNETPQIIKAEYLKIIPTPKSEITGKIIKRSEFSTHFENNPPREHNIELAISRFNGLCVDNGREISFNKIVGGRSEQRGYQEAKIILDGEYVEGTGGGVCQASTTLFNAVVRAGLHITESHNHSLRSYYVPLGHDAMVSSGNDLRFINNTGGTVYFETSVSNNRVFVTIYGRNKGQNIHYKLSAETTKEYPPTETIDKDANIPEEMLKDFRLHPDNYDKIITKNGETGYSVTTYLEVYKGDRLLSKKVLRKSTYKSQPTKYKIVLKSLTNML